MTLRKDYYPVSSLETLFIAHCEDTPFSTGGAYDYTNHLDDDDHECVAALSFQQQERT